MSRPPSNRRSPIESHASGPAFTTPQDQHSRHRSGSYNGVPPSPRYQSGPSSPSSARIPPPSPHDRPSSMYFDPTRAGAREYQPPASTPLNTYQAPTTLVQESGPLSPVKQTPSNPPSSGDMRSPGAAYDPIRGTNGTHSHSGSQDKVSTPAPLPPPPPPQRATNPMSMMNLLSDSAEPPPPPPTAATKQPSPPPAITTKLVSRKTSRSSSTNQPTPRVKQEPAEVSTKSSSRRISNTAPEGKAAMQVAPQPPKSRKSSKRRSQRGPPGLTVRSTELAYHEIESRDLSDVEIEVPGLEAPKKEFLQRSLKRTLQDEVEEALLRKRRRLALLDKYVPQFSNSADAQRQDYMDIHEHEVAEEVRQREIEEDKERKKDQQRKRRREKAIADEKIKRDEAEESLRNAKDDEERARIEKEIQRSEKKIRDTEFRLQGVTPTKDIVRTESPQAAAGKKEREIALDGGLMTSFYTGQDGSGTPEAAVATGGRSRGRGGRSGGGGGGGGGGGRARKSKEQKQAEKDNAARAQAIIDQGQDLPALAPREEERLASYAEKSFTREDSADERDVTPSVNSGLHSFEALPTAGLTGMAKFESKGYNQVYEQITRDLSKAVPKVIRIKNNSLDTKQSNARKTAQLAAKEARRWQLRTNKSTKDVAARAKRAMREMLGFWKRNERDEREGRKAAERQELDRAKKAEAEREANRQKRKLNFLISQTELYSHFIGKKVKTDEIERHGVDGDNVQTSEQKVINDPRASNSIDMPDSLANIGKRVTNFEDLDFDADDETALQEAAMANAQNAIKEAQDKARAFNNQDGSQEMSSAQQDMDDGELNFQNPTSLQSMDITQPKMLSCQLKEYQLKGLNWLVNLYEQGINGILADEMGLGKTVQSISVMAYLAEVHDIWGPFLVIAPASTLHNWQQEIAKFVPTLKVLPYWGNAKDRKILRKFWDRKHITYNRDSQFHVLVTSYQLVVQDTPYFQKVKWQYMILDEAQAIKSSQSSRWKALLGFHCRNRLLLTGTPIQNNMQELWALLHFIMPSLFDSHDEFSEWFSKDIENHAQSNTKLNEDQLRRLHMILKPFMLRRIKKHVQKELGDKVEKDLFCDLTYRQRAYYTNLRNKISIMDLIEKAAVGDDQDTATLMNLVMQFRKVCNHPDLFERADIWSPLALNNFAETASFMREGYKIEVTYSIRNAIEYWLPTYLNEDPGRLDVAGPLNSIAGWRKQALRHDLSIWDESNILSSQKGSQAFSWLRFVGQSAGDLTKAAFSTQFERALAEIETKNTLPLLKVAYDNNDDDKENAGWTPVHSMFEIVKRNDRQPLAQLTPDGHLYNLMNISKNEIEQTGYDVIETCYLPHATAPPIELVCMSGRSLQERETTFFNIKMRRALNPISLQTEEALLRAKVPPSNFPTTNLLPAPASEKQRYTKIEVPSMRRFVTDSGKLAQLDRLLRELKEGGHRVLLYFQMTRMIDLMEEYLTYRNYKYCRLDGSTKLEDRRDTVAAFQSSPDIFVFLLSTRAGGLGINLTSADTVIFYDSDWNPTIDSQAMDRAHRLGQTRQVTVYRLITRGTIEERIRKRALQKEEVQRVVISGQAGGDRVVDFNNRSRENNRTKDIALWLADDDQAAAIERREAEVMEQEAKDGGKKKRKPTGKKKEISMDDMYHEGEGKFDDGQSHEPSGAATPVDAGDDQPSKKRKGFSKKAKTVKERLAVADGR